jgi:hypothetical protein
MNPIFEISEKEIVRLSEGEREMFSFKASNSEIKMPICNPLPLMSAEQTHVELCAERPRPNRDSALSIPP